MIRFRHLVAIAAFTGLAACSGPNPALYAQNAAPDPARRLQSIDWGTVARNAMVGMVLAQDGGDAAATSGGIGSNRDYGRTWTQNSSRGRCTFFGTGGSICRW